MQVLPPAQRLRGREFELSDYPTPERGTDRDRNDLSVPTVNQQHDYQRLSAQRDYGQIRAALTQPEPSAETSLLDENGSLKDKAGSSPTPARWKALGTLGLCILALWTVGALAALGLLTYIWQTSMRARDGEDTGHGLWHIIVRSNWTSITVTLSAAIIRICLLLQMGIFTGMIASLLIERTGIPLKSAPLISMLRAVFASPYQLISKTTLTTPFAIAITIAVLLTTASQFTSTLLLSDFAFANITTPKQTIEVFYGSSQAEDRTGTGTITGAALGTLRGSKIWNSQPDTYFRFAERRYGSSSDSDIGGIDDSGTTLRAILPFTSAMNRTSLRAYEGSAVVFDSRVVCIQPVVDEVNFAIVQDRTNRVDQFDELFVGGRFSLPSLPAEFTVGAKFARWPFNCVMPAPATTDTSYWQTSICFSLGGMSTRDSYFPGLPELRSLVLPMSRTSVFNMFNTTGRIDDWRRYLGEHGQRGGAANENWRIGQLAEKLNWTTSADGAWLHLRPPNGAINASVSISTCFTNLPGVIQTVSMSSTRSGLEPGLSWDKANGRYQTSATRNQYQNTQDNDFSPGSRGLLALHPRTSWEFEGGSKNKSSDLTSWMLFKSVADGLPYMNLNGALVNLEVLASGILLPGAYSPYTVHTPVAQGLQALFTVLRQMAYYEISSYFDMESPATFTMSNERLIPMRWIGFAIVAVIISVHFILLIVSTVFFLGFTKASWLRNVWVSLSQVVSPETEELISKSTDKEDKVVEKLIRDSTELNEGLKYRVKVKRSELSGRNELSSS
ncbi:hypothetical protein CMUS01_12135 [Colletotrichum musicola]|uniref:Uncharacterized protein n=1 Tax=Colletotrichum musicola TaxID=2175873 RepID=A0A8H6JR27_9PEZI|nr:hypothetical protein CMUS01_12135 [Colletotrichum musicola]